jgi:hypothetical protein
VTKKGDKDSQSERWANRLAFLDGITATESESILKEDDDEDDELVPAPRTVPQRPQRRRPSVASARLNARRQAAKAKIKKKRPKEESPSAKARAEVKSVVNRLRDDVLRKAMPGIALNLYRDGRQLISTLTNDSSEYEQQKARWALQAAIDAFTLAERYSDAAEVLIFLARWALRVGPGYDESIAGLIDQARGYLDPDTDRKLLADCDELELLYGATRTRK